MGRKTQSYRDNCCLAKSRDSVMRQVKDAFEEMAGQIERVDQTITRLRDASSKIEREDTG
jgi:hypothetical protein